MPQSEIETIKLLLAQQSREIKRLEGTINLAVEFLEKALEIIARLEGSKAKTFDENYRDSREL